MAQIAPVFTFGCRGSKATFNSQATPTKAVRSEFKGNTVAKRLYLPHDIQYSLATTTFLGKQEKKQSVTRRSYNRVAIKAAQRYNAKPVQQPVGVPVVQYGAFPQIASIFTLVPFIPSHTGTASSTRAKPSNQSLLGSINSERAEYPKSSVRSVSHPARVDEVEDALNSMSQLLAEASDLQTAFARGDIRIEEPVAASEINSPDVTVDVGVQSCSENAKPAADNLENKTHGGENEVHQSCSLEEIFGLDLSDTKDLFEDTYNDIDIDTMCNMYLPPEVPSSDNDVNEVLSSNEFSELMELLDNIEPETLVGQQSSETNIAVSKPSNGVLGKEPTPTPSEPLDEYVPDMFLFSKTEPEVKFDLFDHDVAESLTTCSNVRHDVTSSRKRKRGSSVAVGKRQRLSCRPEVPVLF